MNVFQFQLCCCKILNMKEKRCKGYWISYSNIKSYAVKIRLKISYRNYYSLEKACKVFVVTKKDFHCQKWATISFWSHHVICASKWYLKIKQNSSSCFQVESLLFLHQCSNDEENFLKKEKVMQVRVMKILVFGKFASSMVPHLVFQFHIPQNKTSKVQTSGKTKEV